MQQQEQRNEQYVKSCDNLHFISVAPMPGYPKTFMIGVRKLVWRGGRGKGYPQSLCHFLQLHVNLLLLQNISLLLKNNYS